jgi:hypothetical protein
MEVCGMNTSFGAGILQVQQTDVRYCSTLCSYEGAIEVPSTFFDVCFSKVVRVSWIVSFVQLFYGCHEAGNASTSSARDFPMGDFH